MSLNVHLQTGEGSLTGYFAKFRRITGAEEIQSSGCQRALLGMVTCIFVILLVVFVGGVMAAQIHSHLRNPFVR